MTSFFASLSSTSPAECNLNIHIFQEWIRTSLRLTVTESFLVFSTQGQDCERGSWLLCQRQAGGAVAFFVARNGAWLRGTREQDQPERLLSKSRRVLRTSVAFGFLEPKTKAFIVDLKPAGLGMSGFVPLGCIVTGPNLFQVRSRSRRRPASQQSPKKTHHSFITNNDSQLTPCPCEHFSHVYYDSFMKINVYS